MRRLGLLFGLMVVALAASSAGAFAQNQASTPAPLEMNPDPVRSTIQFVSDPKGAMLTARQKVAAGDMIGAIRGLEIYLAAHPGEVEPQRLLGDLYYRNGQLGKAEDAYRQILVRFPFDKETHNRLGTVYATENRVDMAIAEFNASLPGTESVADLVQLHAIKGDLATFIAADEKRAKDYPTDGPAQTELGEAYATMHRLNDAARYFQRGLDNAPSDLTALNGLGLVLLEQSAYDGAITEFKRCLAIAPDSYTCTDNLGAAQLQKGDYIAARATLDIAHAIAPERAETLVNYGYLADVDGDWKGAVAWYVKALALSPYERSAYFNLGLDYDTHRLYDQAEAVLLKGIAIHPMDGPMHAVLGQTYQDSGKLDLALEQFRLAAASLDPSIESLARERFAALNNGHTPGP